MCSSPKSSGSAKPISIFSGSILSGLSQQKRQQFALRANQAADRRAIKEKQAKEKLVMKSTGKPFSLLSYFYLTANLD
ncbi:hypothetical protein [Psychromonas hadalis]|uniref:hypothetical protein n=1 Tax=Psychromonas hadalis TaxID=211669 RepID=UPI0003B45B79|nr:hypothetical protein [Psychromonas hadalis]